MKGKTTIELINIKNNKKEILEEENIVTDVLEKILTLNPSALTNETSKDIYYPIVEKLMGGILLFKDRIEEEKNTTFITTTNNCIGYAGQNAEIQTDTQNGSFNKQESQKTTSGYKYVWDFGTSKANGRISSLCLTNANAGLGYYGSKDNGICNRVKLGETKILIKDKELAKKYINVVEADFEKNYIVSIIPDKKGIKIIKCREPLLTFNLTDDLNFISEKPIKETRINYKNNFSEYSLCAYVDNDNYYLLRSEVQGENTKITKMTINKENHTAEESIMTLENVKIRELGSYTLDSNYSRKIKSVLRDGYIYAVDTHNTAIIKFNINNPVDLTKIDVPFQIRVDYVTNTNTGCSMYLLGDMICGTNFTIDKNDKVKQIAANDLSKIESTPITYGPFLMGFFANGENYGDKYLRKILYLITPYAATINNLSKTLEKTAEKTMKITYYLTGGK